MKRLGTLLLFLSGSCVLGCASQSEMSSPTTTTAASAATRPIYPAPYAIPTAVEVTKTLSLILQRLDRGSPMRLVDGKTGTEITDYSKPNSNAIMDRGEDKRFNPISYPMGVICSGMLLTAEVTGDQKFNEFAARRYQFFADHYADFQAWEKGQKGGPFHSFYAPDSLDSCGSMGAAMVKARHANVGPDLKIIIDRWADYVHHGQFRLEDGTLARNRPFPNALWGDDMYMSVPLLAQYGKLTGNNEYFDDAAKQVLQMSKRLFVPEHGLYAHAWQAGNATNNPRYYWGRANGWCMVAMVELLDVLPENHPQRAEIIAQLQHHARGVAEVQSGSGLWHQLLDREDSYLETSCTAMFSYAMARGVNRGWLNAGSYGPVAIAGWNSLANRITDDGRVLGTCIGTSYADDAMYYYHRPTTDDIHGYGPVLLAGAEMIRLVQNDHFKITVGANAPLMFAEKK